MRKRVTVKQIAEELGVSIMTVSRALNNKPNVDRKTKTKILEVAKRVGYIPNHVAKSLVLQKTNTIGVVVPEITHSFFPEAIRGIEEATHNAGYHLIFAHSAEDVTREIDALETFASKRVDGIMISTAESVIDDNAYKRIMNLRIPLVFFDRCAFSIGASCVSINDEESAKLITEHLLNHKLSRIAHLSGPFSVSIGRKRYAGYKKALENYGKTVDDELVVESGFHETGGYRATMQLLNLPANKRPDAIVAVNDPAAFGAMKAIREKGLSIPDDISIVGFSDDIRAELMSPPLTTIRQPAFEVGKRAAEKLIRHIINKTEKIEEIVIEAEIVTRKTCKC